MKGDIKEFNFDSLPDDNSEWLVLALGKTINNLRGPYKQQIVLRKLSTTDDPTDIRDIEANHISYCLVDIGRIRIFSPGTIIQNKRIKRFVEEYLEKRLIKIANPQSLKNEKLHFNKQMTMPYLFDINGVNVKRIKSSEEKYEVIIPCSVIADYYFFGTTPLTEAVLNGKLDKKVKIRNPVFNPAAKIILAGSKRIGHVEIGSSMHLRDQVKIARIALDDFYWHKCMGVFTSWLAKSPTGSFIEVNFPVEEPIGLWVIS